MTYRKLGRTDIVSSRLVFGCGAALAGGKAVRVLDRAFEAGINFYDVGTNIYYKGSEQSLAPFMKAHRDQIWVASKAPLRIRIDADDEVSVQQAKTAADGWTKLLNDSLRDLDTEYIDAYYLMAVNNPSLVRSDEIVSAYQQAKQAGKVGYFGVSTHNNAQNVLEAAAETGWYDIAMIGITPGGWYDWDTKDLQEGTPTMLELQPVLQRAADAEIGLMGMKAARHLAPKGTALGSGDQTAFDRHYDDDERAWALNPFQRSYAYVLKHGVDVVNSDMQNFRHLEENLVVVRPGAAG
jgi:aryl-alcohol dehydrogenase-like predicted oxidoreductase